MFRNKSASTITQETSHLTRKHLEFYFSRYLEQIITRLTKLTRGTDQTATLIGHILTNSPEKVSQSGDDDLIYCTTNAYLPKSHKHNEIFGSSMKKYSTKKFSENLREIVFPNCLTYTYVNGAYSDFVHRVAEAINFIAPAKMIRAKANSEPWFDNQTISIIQRRDKLYKNFKHSGLETNDDSFKAAKMHLQKIILKKKKSYFEELTENRNKPKELWKALKSLGLSSDKANKSNTSFKKNATIQFEALENANVFKMEYTGAGDLEEKLPKASNKFTSQMTKNQLLL